MLGTNDAIDEDELKPIASETRCDEYISVLKSSLLDEANFPYKVSCCLNLCNQKLKQPFEAKIREFQQKKQEIHIEYAYTVCGSYERLLEIYKSGLVVNTHNPNCLGTNKCGVYLCRHPDILLNLIDNNSVLLVMHKIAISSSLKFDVNYLEEGPLPNPNHYDCHEPLVACTIKPNMYIDRMDLYANSLVYLYDYIQSSKSFNVGPRQVLAQIVLVMAKNEASMKKLEPIRNFCIGKTNVETQTTPLGLHTASNSLMKTKAKAKKKIVEKAKLIRFTKNKSQKTVIARQEPITADPSCTNVSMCVDSPESFETMKQSSILLHQTLERVPTSDVTTKSSIVFNPAKHFDSVNQRHLVYQTSESNSLSDKTTSIGAMEQSFLVDQTLQLTPTSDDRSDIIQSVAPLVNNSVDHLDNGDQSFSQAVESVPPIVTIGSMTQKRHSDTIEHSISTDQPPAFASSAAYDYDTDDSPLPDFNDDQTFASTNLNHQMQTQQTSNNRPVIKTSPIQTDNLIVSTQNTPNKMISRFEILKARLDMIKQNPLESSASLLDHGETQFNSERQASKSQDSVEIMLGMNRVPNESTIDNAHVKDSTQRVQQASDVISIGPGVNPKSSYHGYIRQSHRNNNQIETHASDGKIIPVTVQTSDSTNMQTPIQPTEQSESSSSAYDYSSQSSSLPIILSSDESSSDSESSSYQSHIQNIIPVFLRKEDNDRGDNTNTDCIDMDISTTSRPSTRSNQNMGSSDALDAVHRWSNHLNSQSDMGSMAKQNESDLSWHTNNDCIDMDISTASQHPSQGQVLLTWVDSCNATDETLSRLKAGQNGEYHFSSGSRNSNDNGLTTSSCFDDLLFEVDRDGRGNHLLALTADLEDNRNEKHNSNEEWMTNVQGPNMPKSASNEQAICLENDLILEISKSISNLEDLLAWISNEPQASVADQGPSKDLDVLSIAATNELDDDYWSTADDMESIQQIQVDNEQPSKDKQIFDGRVSPIEPDSTDPNHETLTDQNTLTSCDKTQQCKNTTCPSGDNDLSKTVNELYLTANDTLNDQATNTARCLSNENRASLVTIVKGSFSSIMTDDKTYVSSASETTPAKRDNTKADYNNQHSLTSTPLVYNKSKNMSVSSALQSKYNFSSVYWDNIYLLFKFLSNGEFIIKDYLEEIELFKSHIESTTKIGHLRDRIYKLKELKNPLDPTESSKARWSWDLKCTNSFKLLKAKIMLNELIIHLAGLFKKCAKLSENDELTHLKRFIVELLSDYATRWELRLNSLLKQYVAYQKQNQTRANMQQAKDYHFNFNTAIDMYQFGLLRIFELLIIDDRHVHDKLNVEFKDVQAFYIRLNCLADMKLNESFDLITDTILNHALDVDADNVNPKQNQISSDKEKQNQTSFTVTRTITNNLFRKKTSRSLTSVPSNIFRSDKRQQAKATVSSSLLSIKLKKSTSERQIIFMDDQRRRSITNKRKRLSNSFDPFSKRPRIE